MQQHKIKKAIIPVAGNATRLYPMSRVIRKAFIPINDNGIIKPIILKLVEELDQSGIEEICLVIGENDQDYYDSFFKKPLKKDYLKKLDEKNRAYDSNILQIGKKIKYIIQTEQNGFGGAIYLCKEFTNNEPVLVVLGDTYYNSNMNTSSCVEQILKYYDEIEKNIIAIVEIDDDEIENVGISSGIWDDEAKEKMTVKKLVEKPKISYAKKHLAMNGKCYGNFGMWIIDHHIFDQIGENIENNMTIKGEYDFVSAIAQKLNDIEIKALKINGKSYDVGNIKSYKKTLLSSINDELLNSRN